MTTPAPALAIRRTRPWLYGTIAAFSIATVPILFSLTLVLGLLATLVGSVVGAASRRGPRQDRAVVTVCCGLACLVGPLLYLGLALAIAFA